MMARLRTTGRGWERRVASTVRGGGLKGVAAIWVGKRVIRIERIDRVSTNASGGVSDYV
jgi:hypothetical protein